jgi:hypothetical protein
VIERHLYRSFGTHIYHVSTLRDPRNQNKNDCSNAVFCLLSIFKQMTFGLMSMPTLRKPAPARGKILRTHLAYALA